jgi:hypothetical protein
MYAGAWIGANDIKTEGKFVWAATGQPITYSNWYSWPDNYYEEDCVQLLTMRDGRWNDINCDSPNHKQITMCERVTPPA